MATGVVITGASRGFGRCLAVEYASTVTTTPLVLVLLARNAAGLSETAEAVRRRHAPACLRQRSHT